MLAAPYISNPFIKAASLAFSEETISPLNPFFLAKVAIERIPLIGRILPSKANSPIIKNSFKLAEFLSWFVADKIPIAIGKS